MNKLKIIPIFEPEKKELELWPEVKSDGYVTLSNDNFGDREHQKSTKSISLKLPEHLLTEIQSIAHKLDVDYKSLIKLYLSDRVNEELEKPLPKIYSNLK